MDNKNLVKFDPTGTALLSKQGIIELAYQDRINDAVFFWQDNTEKQQYESVCEYLDNWPFQRAEPQPNNRNWFTPSEYQKIDLEKYILDRCKNTEEIARAKQELAYTKQLDSEHIFKHLIYLVDTWRAQNRVWGIGRGSSVSCFLLYAIGLNKINPLDYDIDCHEFFKIKQ
jgi:DNA polymerase III alpha subunit